MKNSVTKRRSSLKKMEELSRPNSGMKPTTVILLCFISCFIGSNFCLLLSSSSYDTPATSTHSTPINQKEPTINSTENHLRSKKQRSKTLLQIGANDGVKGNVDFVKNILNDVESKAILVEGSPQIFELLTKNVKTLYDGTQKRIVPVNAMVCEDGKQMTFYYPNIDKLKEKSTEQNLQIPHWVQYQIGSLEQKSTIDGLQYWLTNRRRVFPSALSADEFILQESISCISLASVITQSSLAADEIGVLAVDVEGFDAPVVLESFKVPGLEPDVIVFEHKSTTTFSPEEFNTVMETLEARGYKLDCHQDPKAKAGWKCSDQNNVHAVKEVKN